jgi:multimeric flavodoxin WrbA
MTGILAFNASPRKERSTTDILMNKFIEGATEVHALTNKFYVVDLDINGCKSCFDCWWKTPGKCVQKDDMEWILPSITKADILLLGSPIYGRNITHYLQRFLERTFPLTVPEMYIKKGTTHHPSRVRKFPKMVLASTCGFPDISNFHIVKQLYPKALNIFLPAAQLLFDEKGREYLSEFLQNIEIAGSILGRGEDIPDDLKEKLVFEYPDDMKKQIVERHNLYSAARSSNE